MADELMDADRLATVLDGLLGDPDRLGSMARAAASMGRSDAAAAGARVVEANARTAARGRR